MTDTKFWVAFSLIPRIGPQKIKLLRNHFPTLEQAWQASAFELRQAGLDDKIAEEITLRRKNFNPDQELEKLAKENISFITVDQPDYPKLLKQIHNPPFILYFKGHLDNLHEQTLAVVGSRKMTTYGQQATTTLVEQLANQDIIIVSGLALGIDALAHATAVARQKTTVAVLGSGLDQQNIYPSTNRALAKNILNNNGLLVSEYPIGTLPLRHNFPARNRIISGLSLGTLVIEAGESSGALITAYKSLEQNREVFAVPGQIHHPMSCGTNGLIKKGAKLVQSAEDIFEELNLKQLKQFKAAEKALPESPEHATVLKHLQHEPLHINELVKLTNMTTQEVGSTLMLLEMKGQIKNLGNNSYLVVK